MLKATKRPDFLPLAENDQLFAGLVPHKDAPLDALIKTRMLGEHLARRLLLQGAAGVMATAQAIIHGKANTIST